MLILTDATVPDSLKRRVWIHSRVHTSEAPAAWYLEAMIDELLSDAPLSREILRRTVSTWFPRPILTVFGAVIPVPRRKVSILKSTGIGPTP